MSRPFSGVSSIAPVSSSSCSTARSQSVTWSSAPDAAKMESSVGCHSTDVIGALCHVKDATGVGSGAEVLVEIVRLIASTTDYCPATHPRFFTFRKSQTLIPPSSSPLRRRYAVLRFQLITLTSLLCASSMPATFCLPLLRTSHMRTL